MSIYYTKLTTLQDREGRKAPAIEMFQDLSSLGGSSSLASWIMAFASSIF